MTAACFPCRGERRDLTAPQPLWREPRAAPAAGPLWREPWAAPAAGPADRAQGEGLGQDLLVLPSTHLVSSLWVGPFTAPASLGEAAEGAEGARGRLSCARLLRGAGCWQVARCPGGMVLLNSLVLRPASHLAPITLILPFIPPFLQEPQELSEMRAPHPSPTMSCHGMPHHGAILTYLDLLGL